MQFVKKFATLLIGVVLLSTASTMAATPNLINYQGRLTDSGGAPLDTTVDMTFTIYDSDVSGNVLWTESQSSVVVSDGLLSVQLGSFQTLNATVFDIPDVFLGITVGSDPEISPRIQLVTVPYAFRVSTVDGATGGIISGDVSIQSDLDVAGDIRATGKGRFGSSSSNSGLWAFVAGQGNTASGNFSNVGGGATNTASGANAVIAGGNSNNATANFSSVVGGLTNFATGIGGSVGGGQLNVAEGEYSTSGGGRHNFARGIYSVISGGGGAVAADSNSARGSYSIIPGGRQNLALGNYSFATGRRAKANHAGTFVWADQTDADFTSSTDNQFNVRASGGTRIYSNSGLTAGVTLAAGASSWSSVSDSTLKRNVREVNYDEVLEKVAELPISLWSYEAQDESIEHIGPMAQDFFRLFGLGEDDIHINTLDPDGVALAAIKALIEKNESLVDEMKKLRERVNKLEKELD